MNGCPYRLHHHGAVLRQLTHNEALVTTVLRDPREVELQRRWRSPADFVIALTERPADVREAQVMRLRADRLTDAVIHDAVAIIGYCTFVNRLAQGFHLPLEPPESRRRS